MAKSRTVLDNELRQKFVGEVMAKFFEDTPMLVGGNVIAIPTLDEEGNDSWVEITVKVPKGARLPNGEGFAGYEGYELAESYAIDQKEKAEKAEKAKQEKAKKDKKAKKEKEE